MAEAHLPEEIIVNILSWLPVKSLIRFSCVSKRLHFIIFSDPKFARSQFEAACQQKTLSRRLLISISTDAPQLESLDLQTPSFGDDSPVRKLNFPLQQPRGSVRLLGSCNGLVTFCLGGEFFYIWNPSIGFFKQLPNPGLSLNKKDQIYYGFGYLSATDDYKVFLGSLNWTDNREEVEILSLRTHVWTRIQMPGDFFSFDQGILVNEALHWLSDELEHEIDVFDLAAEEFRKMDRPNFHQLDHLINLGVSFGGCLCLCGHPRAAYDSTDFWVMREYDLSAESWTKLFNLKLSNPPEVLWHYGDVYVMECCYVNEIRLVSIDHKGEEKLGMYKTEAKCLYMIPYEESLLWINQ
ncbi:hypothetical protein M0R45_005618 [Rubus argutus]|uniref:F-box domain-containing protein n=1 Tax=Rubus argutus TaxID=59490 RepID=A0AAW1YNB8_RUBAR